VKLLRQDGTVTVDMLAGAFKISERTILRDFEALRKQERIKRDGSDTSGRWIVIDNGGGVG
jgi:DeoR/GlpR family transcriptional regulator of sugar metabolism